MIKPNLIVSHDWHVQPICQRSFTADPPERGRGSSFPDVNPDVLELVLRGKPEALFPAPAFLREPFKHIELRCIGQALSVFLSLIPAANSESSDIDKSPVRDAQNIKDQPANLSSSFERRTRGLSR